MEHLQGDIALRHAVDEGGYGVLVVARRERGGEPQSEGECWWERGLAREGGVAFESLRGGLAAEEEVIKLFAGDGHTHLRHGVGADLVAHLVGAVDEHAVAPRRNEKRHGFIGLVGAGAAVGVPYLDRLTVLREGGELLAEAVEILADGGVELLADIGAAGVGGVAPEGVVEPGVQVGFAQVGALHDHARGAPRTARELFALVVVSKAPVLAGNDELCVPRDEDCFLVVYFDGGLVAALVQHEVRTLVGEALVVGDGHADTVFLRGRVAYLQIGAAQGLVSLTDYPRGGKYGKAVLRGRHLISLISVADLIPPAIEPETVCEFHKHSPLDIKILT